MSVEAISETQEVSTPQPAPEAGFSLPDDDKDLGAVWDRANVTNGADRDPSTGKFKSANGEATAADENAAEEAKPEEVADGSPVEGEGEGSEPAASDETSTPAEATEVALPPSFRGREAVWAKVPDELKAELAELGNDLHSKLSTQGQQIAASKPLTEIIQEYAQDIEKAGATAPQALKFLFEANREIENDPVSGLLKIAKTYGVEQQIAQRLTNQSQPQGQQTVEADLRSEIAELKRTIKSFDGSAIDTRIQHQLDHQMQARNTEDMVSRVSKELPLYSEIPDQTMVDFINIARSKDAGASTETIFRSAYDMAVHADPTLRAKLAAAEAEKQPKPAASDPKRTENARRAASVNAPSNSSGKPAPLSEDEELSQVWEKNRKG